MTKRRDAIAAQLGLLSDVVAGFGEDELTAGPAEPPPPSPPRSPTRHGAGRPGPYGEPGSPFERHSPFYIGFFGAWARCWRSASDASRAIASVLILVVVSLFLAAGLNPSVEFFMHRGLKRSYAVLAVIVAVARDAGDCSCVAIVPVISDQVAASPKRPAGSTTSRTTRRSRTSTAVRPHRPDPGLRREGDFVSSIFGGVLGVGLAVLSALVQARSSSSS